jgi:hypothetical protein
LQFADLAAGLPDQSRAEFFKILHETGIGPKDTELARLLRALQLYKAFYETIPIAGEEAAGELDRMKEEIKSIAAEVHRSADAGIHISSEVIKKAEQFTLELAAISKHVEGALQKSAEDLAGRIAELLKASVEEKVLAPITKRMADISASNKAFGDAIAQSRNAAEMLRRNIVLDRRAHFKSYAVGGLMVLCALAFGSWLWAHRWYQARIEEERAGLVSQTDKNRALLLELAKSNRTLQLLDDPDHPDRKLIVLKDASGWQSARKHGVIEFEQ